MLLPKPNQRKRRAARRRAQKLRSQNFRALVLAADNNTCQDKDCPCHSRPVIPVLDPHHIVKRGLGGPYSVPNGVTLCRTAHDKTEGGIIIEDPTMPSGMRYLNPTEYMIRVLESHQDEPSFRWADALEHLKQCRDRKLEEISA